MLIVREIHLGGRHEEIARADDVYAAVQMLPGAVLEIMEDGDHPGFYDAMMLDGRVLRQFTIEPETR